MNTLKSTSIAIGATLLLAFAPASYAQDELKMMQTFLSIMQDYMAIIESTHDINSDPEKAAILQMQKIKEIYEDRGEKARVNEVLRDILSQSDNQTIRNTAYMLLGDTLKDTGRSDEAITLMREALAENIKAAP